MKPHVVLTFFLIGAACAGLVRAASPSDLVGPEKRRVSVELALALSRPPGVPALPTDLAQPFNPPNFDQTDAEARAAADVAANRLSSAAPEKPAGDRETLELIAAKIAPSGTMFVGGEPRLIFSKKTVKIGARFTVTYKERDYELELVGIDRTTFTLRLNREEITRPIKSGKSP